MNFYFVVDALHVSMRSFIDWDLSDTDNIVPFENTTPINKIKAPKYKNAEQIDQINRSGICERYNGVSVR